MGRLSRRGSKASGCLPPSEPYSGMKRSRSFMLRRLPQPLWKTYPHITALFLGLLLCAVLLVCLRHASRWCDESGLSQQLMASVAATRRFFRRCSRRDCREVTTQPQTSRSSRAAARRGIRGGERGGGGGEQRGGSSSSKTRLGSEVENNMDMRAPHATWCPARQTSGLRTPGPPSAP